MEHTLSFKLLGTPTIKVDGNIKIFSFSKINALLYYMVINKQISRDEIAGILWPSKDEKSAKKNLRNTIYQANRSLGGEFIVSPNKSILTFNSDLIIESDTYRFEKDAYAHLEDYRDEFLKGFYLKDSDLFDAWLTKMRNLYEHQFIECCYQKVAEDISFHAVADVEKNIRKLIAIDEFDERNYQLLMQFYIENHRNGKAIETYYELAETLRDELGIEPSEETKQLYQRTLQIANQKQRVSQKKRANHFYGRSNEVERLELNLANLKQKKPFQSVLVTGDLGVGKSSLCQLVIENIQYPYELFKVTCYKTEQEHCLRPWRELLQQIIHLLQREKLAEVSQWQQTFSQQFPFFNDLIAQRVLRSIDSVELNFLAQCISEALQQLGKITPVVIFIENLQWMDRTSIRLLTSLILHNPHRDIIFIMTLQSSFRKEIQDFIVSVRRYEKIITLKLLPFQDFEVRAFCEKQLPNHTFQTSTIDFIMRESEGVPLYISEYLNQLEESNTLERLTQNIKDKLSLQFVNLLPVEVELIDLISFFQKLAFMSVLIELVDGQKAEVYKALDNLIKQGLINENIYLDEVCFSFKHNKMKQFIYAKQSDMKLRVIHEKIAVLLEQKLNEAKNDSELLAAIGYHYRQAHQELKSLDYELSHHQLFLRIQHELFPIYHQEHLASRESVRREDPNELEKFKEIGARLKEIEGQYAEDSTYQLLLVRFLYLEGRFFINSGDYNRGIENIQRVIVKAKDFHLTTYLLRGYRQMIYYYIQTDNATDMAHYIDLAMDVAITANNNESIGILLRLKGLYHLMIGDLDQAESYIQESITIFNIANRFDEKYNSNIAAAYDYLAEIQRLRSNYEQSIKLQQKAINLCEGNNLVTSLAIFYVDMGITLYAKKDYDQAETYFLKANEYFEVTTSLWKRVQLNAYLTLIYLHKKDYGKVIEFIEKTSCYQNQLANPRDSGLVYFIKALVKEKCLNERHANLQLNHLVEEDLSYYLTKAMDNLSQYRDRYELQVLKEFFHVNL
ncbi:AAA family ATPase [Enterococcus gallinarum]|uniref:AAA family ATPase n=1 Tax=Enterococcus gallinarum TaxID=1353 RepID=UPI0018AA0311|nr:AAA family ATPase [Enterococcus gallinarum]MDT2685193.1 AAA family ATPase [Enterococcus gallinarum]GMG57538.1 AAA family ATPase [Enterococcus gallinarum]